MSDFQKEIEIIEKELCENSFKKNRKKSKLDPHLLFILNKSNEGWSATHIMNALNNKGKTIVKNKSTITRFILKVKYGN